MSKLQKTVFLPIILGICFYWFSFEYLDKPIAYFFHQDSHVGFIYSFFSFITYFGESVFSYSAVVTSFIIALILFYKQPKNPLARQLMLIVIAMVAAMVCAMCLKYLLGRYRPQLLFQDGLYGFHLLSDQFLLNSSPSGHATRAFVLVTGFSLIWSRFTSLLLLGGILVCLSRMVLEFHYLSDVFFGAMLGTLMTIWLKNIYHLVSSRVFSHSLTG